MAKRKTNKEFSMTSKVFNDACKKAEIEPTTRQASKWRRQTGLAYKTHRKGEWNVLWNRKS